MLYYGSYTSILRNMKSVVIDIPAGTVVWSRTPKVYTDEMQGKNRIRVTRDNRNGTYILVFLYIEHDGTEQELQRMVFKDKADLIEFRGAFLQGIGELIVDGDTLRK